MDNQNICYSSLWQISHFLYKLVISINSSACVICWGLKSSKLYHTQCEIKVLVSSAEVWKAPNYFIRNAESMCWYHLLRSEKLQTSVILYAVRNQCFGIICWGLKSSKLYYTQFDINVLLSSAGIWTAPHYGTRNAKSMCWYHLLRSEKLQTTLYAMRNQYFGIS